MKKNRYHLPTSKHIPNSKHLPILVKCAPLKSKINPYLHKNGKPTLLSKIITHRKIMIYGGCALTSLLWASDILAATRGLEESLDQVQKLATGQIARTGFGVVTVLAGIKSIMSGSIGLAMACFAIGIATVFYLDWIIKAFSPAGGA
jgi:type IV secretory pathway VirB2 component (pilin)